VADLLWDAFAALNQGELIYRRTGNLRAVQLGLGHKKIESTVRHLAIEVDDALAIAEQVNYRGKADRLCPFLIIAKVPHPDLHRQRGCEGQKRSRLRIERLEQRLGLFQIGSV
jgi:hypothetical protein